MAFERSYDARDLSRLSDRIRLEWMVFRSISFGEPEVIRHVVAVFREFQPITPAMREGATARDQGRWRAQLPLRAWVAQPDGVEIVSPECFPTEKAPCR